MKKILGILTLATLSLVAQEVNIKDIENTLAKGKCEIHFKDLVVESLDSHPSILMSKSMLDMADAQIDSAFWERFPTVNLEHKYHDSIQNSVSGTIEQPIWAGGMIDAKANQADAYKDESQATLEESKIKLIDMYLNTLKDYMQSKSKLAILNNNLEEYKKLSKTFKRMLKAGILSEADQNLFYSKLAAIDSEKLIAQSKLDISKMKFEILSDKQLNCEVFYRQNNLLNEKSNIKNIVNDIISSHPALKILQANLKNAMEELKINRSVLSPKLSFVAEHKDGSLYKNSDDDFENLGYLKLSMNFGAGLSSLSNMAKTRAQIKKIKMEILKKKNDLTDEVVNDYMNYIKAKEYSKIVNKDMWNATKIYDSNKRLFESQKKSWLDVVNSLSEVSKQKIKYEELSIEQDILDNMIALKSGKLNLNTFKAVSE